MLNALHARLTLDICSLKKSGQLSLNTCYRKERSTAVQAIDQEASKVVHQHFRDAMCFATPQEQLLCKEWEARDAERGDAVMIACQPLSVRELCEKTLTIHQGFLLSASAVLVHLRNPRIQGELDVDLCSTQSHLQCLKNSQCMIFVAHSQPSYAIPLKITT
jgi:hypothetical protein